MGVIAEFLAKVLTWLGTILFIRKGAKDEVKHEQAEKTLEVVNDLNRPRSQSDIDELWERNKAKYR